MQTLIMEAISLESARGFRAALSGFNGKLTHEAGTYQVTVMLDGNENIVAVLDALAEHVTQRGDGPAVVELGGRVFKLHPTDEPKPE